MRAYLMEKGLSFAAEYSPEGLYGMGGSRLRFDFALFRASEIAFLIELDGMQHICPISYFGGMAKYEQLTANDARKNEWAAAHHLELIRIDVSECRLDTDFTDLYEKVFTSYHILD